MGGLSASSFVGNFGFQVVSEPHAELDAQTIQAADRDSSRNLGFLSTTSLKAPPAARPPPPPAAALVSTPEHFENRSTLEPVPLAEDDTARC